MIISWALARMAGVRRNSVVFLLRSLFPGVVWIRMPGTDERRVPITDMTDFDFRRVSLPIRFYAAESGNGHPSVRVMRHDLSISSMSCNASDEFVIELMETILADNGVPSLSRVMTLMPHEVWEEVGAIPGVKLGVLYRRGLLAEKLDGIGTVIEDLFPWGGLMKRLSPYIKRAMPS
ncbi:MAG: hypothetical protein HGA38_02150 [Candidatus Moranbacteria bacterium]|nr:hypothetical protein [Candidatus Moranbacteria bacterium]NTW45697.1 hypothetical protein [Candidatus Moranbacteria bacterium]